MLILWGIAAASSSVLFWHQRNASNIGSRALHVALLIILLGSLVTHLKGERGTIDLSTHTPPTNGFFSSNDRVGHLPFSIQLLDCKISQEGSDSPTPFRCRLAVYEPDGSKSMGEVSVNNIFRYRHWRFCLQAVSPHTCSLRVSYDPMGIGITYLGYGMLLLGILLRLSKQKQLLAALARPSLFAAAGVGGAVAIASLQTDVAPVYAFLNRPSIFIAAGLCLLFFIGHFSYGSKRLVASKRAFLAIRAGLYTIALWSLSMLVLRGCMIEQLPFSGETDIMLLLSFFGSMGAIHFCRRPLRTLLFVGLYTLTLFAAAPHGALPPPRPLPPILRSPLLFFHVTSVMAAYALLLSAALLSAAALCSGRSQGQNAFRLTRALLSPAVLLLMAGIFTGAVWGNIAWGSYWSWDPKETWALITLLIYSPLLHHRLLPPLTHRRIFFAYTLFAFLAILMCYYGVGRLLGGMHSYA